MVICKQRPNDWTRRLRRSIQRAYIAIMSPKSARDVDMTVTGSIDQRGITRPRIARTLRLMASDLGGYRHNKIESRNLQSLQENTRDIDEKLSASWPPEVKDCKIVLSF